MSDSDESRDRGPGGADSFLSRWSRRKVAARSGAPLPEPAASNEAPSSAAAPGASSAVAPDAPVELPPVDSLRGLESEYGDFLRPEVDDATQRAALRKLFADPHFNRMDGLDVYIDDYTIPDPIPEAMMATLEHAKALLRPEQPAQPIVPVATAGADAGEPQASAPSSQLDVTSKEATSADAAVDARSHEKLDEQAAGDDEEEGGPASAPRSAPPSTT